MLAEVCQKTNLFQQINQLYCKSTFMMEDHNALEQIDQVLTSILTRADKQCHHKQTYPWSPELHHVYLTHRYWSIRLSKQCMHQDMSAALAHIHNQLPTSPENNLMISASLRCTRKHLCKIRWHAHQKRQDYLNSLLEAVGQANDVKKQKLILHL